MRGIMNTRRPLDGGDLSADSSDALCDGINGTRRLVVSVSGSSMKKLVAAALLPVRGTGKICWRGGYRLRCVVSVQAEEEVKIQAEQPNRKGREREQWGGEGQAVWDCC